MPTPRANEVWAATNVMTQMATRLQGAEKYLGHDDRALGSKVGDNAYELFTICPASEVLSLFFQQQQPTFIAIHDVGSAASATFLTELGAALKRPMQRLTIRQQGSGATLAVLGFIELPTPRGVPVRVYATSVEAEPSQRRPIAEVLLAFSRLGVLLVQAPSEHLLSAQLGLLRDRVLTVPWNNRDLLLVPRIASPKLEESARRLVDGTLVKTICAQPASTTTAIWQAIHSAWSRLRSGAAGTAEVATRPAPPAPARPAAAAAAPTVAPAAEAGSGASITLRSFGVAARPAPAAQRAAPAPTPARQSFDAYARACAGVRGVQACLIFDRASQQVLAAACPSLDPSAWIGSFATTLDASKSLQDGLGGGDTPLDVVTTLDHHVLVVRTLPRRPDIGMAVIMDKALANATAWRPQQARLDAMLDQ